MTIVSRMLERGDLRERCRAESHSGIARRPRLGLAPRTMWEALLRSLAPMGYEDKTGFHYGLPPANGDLSE